MTTQEDLERYLKIKKIDDYIFHYIQYDKDILQVIKIAHKSQIKHHIIMLMSPKNNHWVYIYVNRDLVYYYDSYGCIPNMYQLIDDFNIMAFNQLYEKRKIILKKFKDKLPKEIKLFYNDYVFQKNVFGILQGDVNDKPTDTCGEFVVCTAGFLDKYDPKWMEPDIYILTKFNRFQSMVANTYDELALWLAKIKID